MNKPNLKQILLIIVFLIITLLTLLQTAYDAYLFFASIVPNFKKLIQSTGIIKFDYINVFIRILTIWILYVVSSSLIFRLFKSFRK